MSHKREEDRIIERVGLHGICPSLRKNCHFCLFGFQLSEVEARTQRELALAEFVTRHLGYSARQRAGANETLRQE